MQHNQFRPEFHLEDVIVIYFFNLLQFILKFWPEFNYVNCRKLSDNWAQTWSGKYAHRPTEFSARTITIRAQSCVRFILMLTVSNELMRFLTDLFRFRRSKSDTLFISTIVMYLNYSPLLHFSTSLTLLLYYFKYYIYYHILRWRPDIFRVKRLF